MYPLLIIKTLCWLTGRIGSSGQATTIAPASQSPVALTLKSQTWHGVASDASVVAKRMLGTSHSSHIHQDLPSLARVLPLCTQEMHGVEHSSSILWGLLCELHKEDDAHGGGHRALAAGRNPKNRVWKCGDYSHIIWLPVSVAVVVVVVSFCDLPTATCPTLYRDGA